MNTPSLAQNPQALETITLPATVARLLKREAHRSRLSVAEYLTQWLEDQVDGRDAAKVSMRIHDGQEKVYPAAEVWARHDI